LKKMKFISAILMFSMMMIGVAYANWDEAYRVNDTVSTGYFDILVIPGDISEPEYMKTRICLIENSNDLCIKLDQFYPGATVVYDFCVENTGTLAIKLDDFILSYQNYSETLDNEFEITFSYNNHIFYSLDDFIEKIETDELNVGEIQQYYVKIIFDKDGSIETGDLEKESMDYIFKIGYKQFNSFD